MTSVPATSQPRRIRVFSSPAVLGNLARAGLAVVIAALAGGCALKTDVVPTQPSAITQRLLFRALERALAQLDLSPFSGRRVSVDLISQTKDDGFAKRFLVDWLREHRVQVVSDQADLKLDVIASVLGTDHGQTLLGVPSLQSTLVPVATPEISLFKWERHRGRTDLQIYAFEASTDTFVRKSATAVGVSKQDDYTLLLLINFTVSDLEKPPPASSR
jgi:hypothetical protein